MMDQGEPGKDLPILEQTWEADPHETESSKKMEEATELTPNMLKATTEMVNTTFEVTAPHGPAGVVFPLRECVTPCAR